jgi:hypothetical protein
LVGADGGVFAFGGAPFLGSVPGLGISVHNVCGIVATPTGKGYWIIASDGGVFSFGDAQFFGSLGGHHLNQPIVGGESVPAEAGTSAAASTLTGRITGVNISKGDTAFGAPVGITSASSSTVETLSPDVTVTPSNLSVRINTTATTGLLVGLTWGSNGFFTCSVDVGTGTCTNSSSGASIPPGTPYSVFVTPGTTSFTGDVLFGYQLSG